MRDGMAEVMEIFQTRPKKEACLYNTLLDLCIDAKDQGLAKKVILDALASGTADAVTFNEWLDAYIRSAARGAPGGSLRR